MQLKSLKRALITLVCLIIITLIYIGVQTHTGGTRKPFISYALTSSDKPKKVSKIEITAKDTLCVFEPINGEWKLTAPVEYPLDTAAFNQFLHALQELEIGEIISNKPEKYADFEVADNGVIIKVHTSRDSVSLILGKQSSDYIHWYIRMLPKTEVRLSKGLAKYLVDKGPDKWRDPSIISFDANSLKELTIGNKKIIKTDTIWQWDTGKIDKQKVDQAINILSNLKADGFSKEELKPEFTVKLTFIDGNEKLLNIGQKINDNYLIKLDDNPVIFLITSWKVDRIKEIFGGENAGRKKDKGNHK